jgi:hypothetical protein
VLLFEVKEIAIMSRYKTLAAASLALVLLAACGSSGIGDILGGGSGSNNGNYEIRGTVESVDTSSRSVYLRNVSGLTNMLSSGGSGSTARVYFDEKTTVDYQGQTFRPENLERGDEVTVSVDESGNQLIAQRMTVTYNANGNTSSTNPSSGNGSYTSTVRGTVRSVDANRRTIEVDRGSGSMTFVEFDTNTPVYYSNQTYRPADLERGDEIDVRVRDLGNGRLVADQVTVVRSVSSGGLSNPSSSSNTATVRGTVRSIDTSRRSIQLESTSWLNNFNGNNTGTGSTITVYYDANANIDVNGQMQSISGLERGDVIEVQLRSSGSTYVADRLYLVRDINSR